MDPLYRSALSTRFGDMQLAVDTAGVLVELRLPGRAQTAELSDRLPFVPREGMRSALRQLDEYFSGKRRAFDLQLAPRGSSFELAVWARLCRIPFGATASYGAIAAELALENGARAVGRANGSNPIAIVIPCHRVIGSDGNLVGYGGGLPLKRALLELEGALVPEPTLFHL